MSFREVILRDPKNLGFEPYPARSPFNDLLGPMHARMEDDGGITLGFWVLGTHLNHLKSMHGGMATTLADTAMGNHATRAANDHIATVHLSVDYFSRISEGDWLEVRSRLDRKGKRLLFLSATASVGDQVVFRANGVFSVVASK